MSIGFKSENVLAVKMALERITLMPVSDMEKILYYSELIAEQRGLTLSEIEMQLIGALIEREILKIS